MAQARDRRLVRTMSLLVLVAVLAAVLPVIVQPAAASGYPALDGRTIRYIIGTAAGGGNDTLGRLLATAMAKLLPQTSFRTQNMAGAGGGVAVAALQGDSSNLVSLAFTTSGIVYGQLMTDQPPFDIRDLHWIGSVGNNQRIVAAGKALGKTDWRSLKALGRPLVLPTNGSLGQAATTEAFMLDAITGLDIKVVPGVEEGQISALLLSGEADLTIGSYGSLKAAIDAGDLVPILRFGGVGFPAALDKLPTIAEVAQSQRYAPLIGLMEGLSANGRLVMAAPNTPPQIVAALQAAFRAAILDPDYGTAMAKLGVAASGSDGPTVAARIDGFLNSGDQTSGDQVKALLKFAIACGQTMSEGTAKSCP